jgi:hypothetical protein
MIIIMAQGHGHRWNRGGRKHLIQVPHSAYRDRTTSIINRLVFQCNSVSEIPLVVGWGDLLSGIEANCDFFRLSDPGKCLFDGIRRVSRFFEDPTIILLGDVIFSNSSFSKATTSRGLLGRVGANKITGKQAGEMFALSFSPPFSFTGKRLWDIYENSQYGTFHGVDDWTDDIDSPQEFDKFYKKLVKAALND